MPTAHYHQKSAFASICNFIESEVIENQQSALVTTLADLYKAEYAGYGGTETDVASY